jgi:hypothetical protein
VDELPHDSDSDRKEGEGDRPLSRANTGPLSRTNTGPQNPFRLVSVVANDGLAFDTASPTAASPTEKKTPANELVGSGANIEDKLQTDDLSWLDPDTEM